MFDLVKTHAEAKLLLKRALLAGDASFWGLADVAPTIFDLKDGPTKGMCCSMSQVAQRRAPKTSRPIVSLHVV